MPSALLDPASASQLLFPMLSSLQVPHIAKEGEEGEVVVRYKSARAGSNPSSHASELEAEKRYRGINESGVEIS